MFQIGQFFQKTYPPEAAVWCGRNNAYIEKADGGYQIKEIPAPSLDTVKEEKINALKEQRDLAEKSPVEYNGRLFDFDDKSQNRIRNAIVALESAGGDAFCSWTCADNTEAIVTAGDLRAVIVNGSVRSSTLHGAYNVAKEAVMVASAAEEVQAISLRK